MHFSQRLLLQPPPVCTLSSSGLPQLRVCSRHRCLETILKKKKHMNIVTIRQSVSPQSPKDCHSCYLAKNSNNNNQEYSKEIKVRAVAVDKYILTFFSLYRQGNHNIQKL